jgi:hypothetical protein
MNTNIDLDQLVAITNNVTLNICRQIIDVKSQVIDLRRRIEKYKNPLNNSGMKLYSQNEEDGITLEILRRMGVQRGVFAEFGVGDGLENNTLLLAACRWRGFWVGGEDLAFDPNVGGLKNKNFSYLKSWITRENIATLYQDGLSALSLSPSSSDVDVISLDLDGNDIYLVEELLRVGARPKLFIVEYNSKFIPPIRWKIDYNDKHTWSGDDYFGASLCSYQDMFESFGYQVICCNAHTGSNAFFVPKTMMHLFNDIPNEIIEIWMPPNYHSSKYAGHLPNIKTIEIFFRELALIE